MLVIDVITTERQVLSACIWISRVHEPDPNAPLELEPRGADADPDDGAGAGDEPVDDPPVWPPEVPPPDGGGCGVATGEVAPGDGLAAPNPAAAEAEPHSRSPTLRSAIMLRFVMSLASARLPYSQPLSGRLIPVTFWSPSCTLSCDHVNEMLGPTGSRVSAVRSENVRREKNGEAAFVTRRALPRSSVF